MNENEPAEGFAKEAAKESEKELEEEQGLEQGLEQGVEQGIERGLKQEEKQGIEQGLKQEEKQGFEQGIEQQLEQGIEQETELAWKEIHTEHIIKDQWIDFRKTSYRYPDGHIYEPFYTYTRKDYTVIVATDEAGNYLCVRQFRQGIRQVTTEFPAGGIEKGENTALACAQRELTEETGYVSDEWAHLLTIPSDATICDNYAHIFTAKNCRKVGEQHLDETERVNVALHSAWEIDKMIRAGEFQQAVHVLAWLLANK